MYVNAIYHSQWRNWRGFREANYPPDKLNIKTGLLLNLYFGFGILLVYTRLLFTCFSDDFPGV